MQFISTVFSKIKVSLAFHFFIYLTRKMPIIASPPLKITPAKSSLRVTKLDFHFHITEKNKQKHTYEIQTSVVYKIFC